MNSRNSAVDLGFLSHLPRQRRLLEIILPHLQRTPWIQAVWLGGSLARRDADNWSDVNLHLLVKNGHVAQVKDWLPAWLHEEVRLAWLPLADARDAISGITRLDRPIDVGMGGVHFSVCWTDAELLDRHLKSCPARRLLFARSTLDAALHDRLAARTSHLVAPDWNVVHDNLYFFWRPLSRLPAALNRQEHLAASRLLEEARQILIDLVVALNGARRPLTEARINPYLGPTQLEAFEKTLTSSGVDAAAWIGQAVALIVLYRWYAPQLVEIYGIPYPATLEQTVLSLFSAQVEGWPALIQTG